MELETEIIRPRGSDFTEKPNDEADLLPEYCHYQDEGCEFAYSCLNCPFARCIYDERGGKQRFIKDLRNQEMLRLYSDGKEIEELAATFGVSQRTVQRALKRAKNE
jgi:hypothetical protein